MKLLVKLAAVATMALSANSADAATCIGVCGVLPANGDVPAPPSGSATYEFVTTAGGVTGAGQITGVGGTNGSQLTTDTFSAAAGDPLNLFFNYVTSDGAGFSDYAFAELLTGDNSSLGFLFTARTASSGNTSPGNGLPNNISTLTPGTSAIQNGTTWAGLAESSGGCFSTGCGNTGWIQSTYNFGAAGQYKIRFGTTNVIDTVAQSGLAFSGLSVAGAPVGAVPEPTTWVLMLMGMAGVGFSMRRKTNQTMRVRFA